MRVKKSLSIVLSLLLLISAMYVPLAFTAYADASFEAQHMEVNFDDYDAANTYKIYQGVASTASYDTWDGNYSSGWEGGSGTKEDPYQIATAEQLARLAILMNWRNSYYPDQLKESHGKYWILTNDIVLNDTTNPEWYNGKGVKKWAEANSDNAWKNPNFAFCGNLNGQGHTIKGLYIKRSTSEDIYAGLFVGLGKGAVIENLKISDSYIEAKYAAAVTGGISNIVTSEDNAPIVRRCYIDDSVIIKGTNAAGIMAYNGKPIKVVSCYVGAEITGTGKSGSFIGTSWNDGSGGITVEDSYSSSAIAPFGHQNVAGKNSYVNSANNGGFKQFDPEAATGEGAKTKMPKLDYKNTWVTLPGSKPQLRVFCNKDAYQPCSVVPSETDKYMKIEKSAGSFTAGGEEYRVGFMLNKTGAADAPVYELEAGGKYRVALNYIATEGVKVAAYSANSASETKMVRLGSQDLPAAEAYSDFSFDFTVPEVLDNGVNALYLAFETTNNYDGTTSFAVNVTDVVVDRLGTITVDDGTDTQEYVGVPACNVADAPYSECAAEVLNLPKSAVTEKYAYTTDPANATATAYGLAYYNDEAKTKEITEPITFTADDKTVYAETKTVVDTTYQMAFTGFENDVYKSRKPEPYYTGVSYYDMPGVVFRGPLKNGGSESGLEITKEDAYTGSSSMKYDSSQITKPKSNYRAIYIGNRFEFTPERTYAISFYVKAAKGNTASSVKFAVRGGVSCSEWSDRNNNVKSANVPLTENWQKVTINYKPNKHTNLASGITNENAYYVPQLCVDYGQLDGKYTEGAKFYIDTLSIDVIKGDCNGDGERDILDLVRIKKISLDSENGVGYVAEELKAANFDSTVAGVDAQDVTAFKKGILSNFQ